MKMQTMLILTLLSAGLLLAGTGIAGADYVNPIVTGEVPVSATLGGVNTLSVEPVIYGGVSTGSIDFGSVPAGTGFLVPGQYVKVDHNDNSLGWEIKIYTNNFTIDLATWDPYDPADYGVIPATATWGFQYGGMKGTQDGARTPMAWHADIADSASSPFAVGSATDSATTGWSFVKDKADRDDPGTTDPDEIESYEGPDGTAAYTNVAFGGPDYQNVVDPRESDYIVEDGNKTFVIHIEGIFGSAPGDTYATTISFDLVHQ